MGFGGAMGSIKLEEIESITKMEINENELEGFFNECGYRQKDPNYFRSIYDKIQFVDTFAN